MEKICCGGFYLGEGLELDGRTLKGTGGSGLPDPSSLPDGTALIKVGNEWKKQEGYGYTGEPAFEPITWDGNTEGRASIEGDGIAHYKVSDDIITAAQFIGATCVIADSDEEASFVVLEESIVDIGGLVGVSSFIISGVAGTYAVGETALIVPEDGTYFFKVDGTVTTSLTAPSTVHQFDPALIPASGDYTVTFSFDDDNETYTCDKALNEIVGNSNAKFVLHYQGAILHAAGEAVNPSAPEVYATFDILAKDLSGDKLLHFVITYNDTGISGVFTSYALTPAT